MVDLSANALTTLARIKTDLGIGVSTYDEQLKRLINSVSDYIEQYCSRSFYRVTTQVDLLRGMDSAYLLVSRTPLNSITSIVYDGTTVDSNDYTLVDPVAGIIEREGGWNWTAHIGDTITRSPLPGTERYLYTVTYDGGWYTPKQEDDTPANTRALPWDLEEACLELVRQRYLGKSQNPNVTMERLLDWTASYGVGVNTTSILDAVYQILNRYRRMV